MANLRKVLEKLQKETESPEARLVLAILKSGLDDKDSEYFRGAAKQHCRLLGLNYKAVKQAALRDIFFRS